ncbi:MAG: response regulator transcription factor [Chloroflexi bacterium]|nr:response regulator transcription factor [Chloroflexota bacterium]
MTSGTVANHIANILDRLGVNSRVQIACWAVENGLVPSRSRSGTGSVFSRA